MQPTPKQIHEAARLVAAVSVSPAPEPGHSLAIETEAERAIIEHPDLVEAACEPRAIAFVLREWRGF